MVHMKLELNLPADPDLCYRQFCDPKVTKLWLPDLKRLKVVREDAKGRPAEIQYSLGESLTYALVYKYADTQRTVRWVPSAGVMDGVSGYATFEKDGDGCAFTYSIDSRRGRTPWHAHDVAKAFRAFILKSAS